MQASSIGALVVVLLIGALVAWSIFHGTYLWPQFG